MDEKSLDKIIAAGVDRGEIDLDLDDEIVDGLLEHPPGEVSDARAQRLVASLQIRRQDTAIARARQMVMNVQSLPFGRFVEAVREKAGITRLQIADRLKKDEEYVYRIERGDVSPTSLPVPDCVDIMGLLMVGIRLVSEMIAASIRIAHTKHTYRASARSHGGLQHELRTDDVERALDAFARKMQNRRLTNEDSEPDVDLFVTRIRGELERRGRKDLLV